MLIVTDTSIFESPAQVLVNPVNCVGKMGKGLAKAFKEHYPDYDAHYQATCEQGQLDYGHLHVYATTNEHGKVRWLISFPTKYHWRDKSELCHIEAGLIRLRRVLETHLKPHSVSIPPLGCGEGGLAWSDVKALIFKHLDLPTLLTYVHEYPPQ